MTVLWDRDDIDSTDMELDINTVGIDLVAQKLKNRSCELDLPYLSDFPVIDNFKKFIKES